MKKWLALVLVLGVLTVIGAPAMAEPMTIADVVQLAKGGAGDDVIMSQIEASKVVFTLTVQDILDLKEAGVSDRVLTFMINTGKNPGGNVVSTVPGDGQGSSTDTRQYEQTGDGAAEPGTQAEGGYSDLNSQYQIGVGVGFGWSPYWNISLGWGYGGYYDPWYCGYWPSYWGYYTPVGCYSNYWACPPYYYGWCDYGYGYGYPAYYSERTMKDGRSVYGRGGQSSQGGSDYASGYGRGYKGQQGGGNGSTPERAVSRSRVGYGGRSSYGSQSGLRPANPPIGTQTPSGLQSGRSSKRSRGYQLPDVKPPVAPTQPQAGTPKRAASQRTLAPPSQGGRGLGSSLGFSAPRGGASRGGASRGAAPAPRGGGSSHGGGRTSKRS